MLRMPLRFLLVLSLSPAYAAQIPSNTYAQELLSQVARQNPSVLSMAIIATPPKASQSAILASTNRNEVGKTPASAELAMVKPDETSSKVSADGSRLEFDLALHDVGNSTIGVLHLSYPYHAGSDRSTVEHDALKIRDALHRRISHVGNLLDPFPYETDAPTDTYAQKLVDEFILKYPEIEILAIHVTPPDSDYNVIAGSNIGRVGKKADNDDMRCVYTGKPNLEINSTGTRFESEMQLHDRGGAVIGAVGIVVAYKSGDDKEVLHARAERIKADLETRIMDAASLFQPAR